MQGFSKCTKQSTLNENSFMSNSWNLHWLNFIYLALYLFQQFASQSEFLNTLLYLHVQDTLSLALVIYQITGSTFQAIFLLQQVKFSKRPLKGSVAVHITSISFLKVHFNQNSKFCPVTICEFWKIFVCLFFKHKVK